MLKFIEVTAYTSYEDAGEPRIINLAHVVQVETVEAGSWNGGARIRLSGGETFTLHEKDQDRVLEILRGTTS